MSEKKETMRIVYVQMIHAVQMPAGLTTATWHSSEPGGCTVEVSGSAVIFRHTSGRRLTVPRAWCAIVEEPEPT